MASSRKIVDYCKKNKDVNPSIVSSMLEGLRGEPFGLRFNIHGRFYGVGNGILQSPQSPLSTRSLNYEMIINGNSGTGHAFYTDYPYTKEDFLNMLKNIETTIWHESGDGADMAPDMRYAAIGGLSNQIPYPPEGEEVAFYTRHRGPGGSTAFHLITFPYVFQKPIDCIYVKYKAIHVSLAPVNNFSGDDPKEKIFTFERYSNFLSMRSEINRFLEGRICHDSNKYRFYTDSDGQNQIQEDTLFDEDKDYTIYYDIAPQYTINYIPIDNSLPQLSSSTIYDGNEISFPLSDDYTYYDSPEKNNVIFFPIQPIQDMTIYYDTRQPATITFAPLSNTEVNPMIPESQTSFVGLEISLGGYNAPFYTDQNGNNYAGIDYRITGDATLYYGEDKYVYLTIVNPHTNEAIALPYRSNETVDLIKLGLTTGDFSTDPEFLNTINGTNLKMLESMTIFYDGDDFSKFIVLHNNMKL